MVVVRGDTGMTFWERRAIDQRRLKQHRDTEDGAHTEG